MPVQPASPKMRPKLSPFSTERGLTSPNRLPFPAPVVGRDEMKGIDLMLVKASRTSSVADRSTLYPDVSRTLGFRPHDPSLTLVRSGGLSLAVMPPRGPDFGRPGVGYGGSIGVVGQPLWRKREVIRQERTVEYTTIDADGVQQELCEKEISESEVLHLECRGTGEFAHRETTQYEKSETFNNEVVAEVHGTEEYVRLKSVEDEYEYMESTMPKKAEEAKEGDEDGPGTHSAPPTHSPISTPHTHGQSHSHSHHDHTQQDEDGGGDDFPSHWYQASHPSHSPRLDTRHGAGDDGVESKEEGKQAYHWGSDAYHPAHAFTEDADVSQLASPGESPVHYRGRGDHDHDHDGQPHGDAYEEGKESKEGVATRENAGYTNRYAQRVRERERATEGDGMTTTPIQTPTPLQPAATVDASVHAHPNAAAYSHEDMEREQQQEQQSQRVDDKARRDLLFAPMSPPRQPEEAVAGLAHSQYNTDNVSHLSPRSPRGKWENSGID